MKKGKSRSWPKVVICTDGSCEPNPGAVGWGAILTWPDSERQKEIKGYIGESTSNVAELTAAIEALKLLEEPHRVELQVTVRQLGRVEQPQSPNSQRSRCSARCIKEKLLFL
jgi:RNase H